MRKIMVIFSLLTAGVSLMGCSTLEVADPKEVIKHPLGTETIRLGMTK